MANNQQIQRSNWLSRVLITIFAPWMWFIQAINPKQTLELKLARLLAGLLGCSIVVVAWYFNYKVLVLLLLVIWGLTAFAMFIDMATRKPPSRPDR